MGGSSPDLEEVKGGGGGGVSTPYGTCMYEGGFYGTDIKF
jgi:hypothetical protein